MKLSIITPTYNHAKYIETTINSVLSNNYNNLEYIVIDGGSKDGTQDIVQKYSDHITHFISEKDDGQADAINKGFALATGDIYAYINSDDYYYPDTFNKVMRIFEENPDIDVIYGNCLFVTEDEQFLRYFTEIEPYNEYRLRSLTDFIMQPSCFWRKEIYDQCGGFTKDFHFGFDWEMWCRMAEKGAKFFYFNELLAVNREFEETKTSTGGKKRLYELKQINLLHKQSWFPYAYYSYASAEHRLHNLGKNFKEKVIWKLSGYFYRLFSFNNILYYYQNYGKNDLYGVRHHSNVLHKEAVISLPYYKNDEQPLIAILLSSHLTDQKVNISVNGKPIHQGSLNHNSSLILHQVSDLNVTRIDIRFTFDKEELQSQGLKQKLLGKKNKYSADLLMCKYLTSEQLKHLSYHPINK